MNKKNLIIFVILVFSLIAGAGFLFYKNNSQKFFGPHLVISPREYDFGKILQSQPIVLAYFDVLNNGSQDAVISGMPTSCSCTSAEISQKEIKPGETAKLKVSFDSNFHEEPEGKFFRSVSVKYNSSEGVETPEIKVWMEIFYDLGKDKLKFGKDLD
ncbi:DUF1573 domain-containing protein [Candidatus Wolfebacteria bacterium]|nr:DUF1573 domain-containing protein [Candidatus Wolfebacteria bacterium]